MDKKPLGRLEKVPLREVWTSEASGFTPWLAKKENLKILADVIGVELECESQERQVGPFRADILCKDTTTDSWVLIENQLERTDHGHLGQLLTYAAGLEAVTVVWIARKFTDEHRATLDWLNERTDEKINLFGIEIELGRIGGSPVAPIFTVKCRPNNWSRTVKQAAGAGQVTEHKLRQLKFWTAFKEYMEEKRSSIRCPTPPAKHWMGHGIGCAGVRLASSVSLWDLLTGEKSPEIRVEFYLNGKNSKAEFAVLRRRKTQLEKALGFRLDWQNLDERHACRISVRKKSDAQYEKLWPQQFEWLRVNLEAIARVFAPAIKTLRAQEAA